jgi:hypothetical protein
MHQPFIVGCEDHMLTTTKIPVTVSPDARSFIDRVDQGEEFEKMIDRAGHIVPDLRSIEVVLDEATEEMPAGVVLWIHRDEVSPGGGSDGDPTHRDWIDWMAATFPPDVCRNFTLLSIYHDHGR